MAITRRHLLQIIRPTASTVPPSRHPRRARCPSRSRARRRLGRERRNPRRRVRRTSRVACGTVSTGSLRGRTAAFLHGRNDRTEVNGIDPYALLSVLEGGQFGHGTQCAFRSLILRGAIDRVYHTFLGGNVDDGAACCFAHLRYDHLGLQK